MRRVIKVVLFGRINDLSLPALGDIGACAPLNPEMGQRQGGAVGVVAGLAALRGCSESETTCG